MIQLIAYLLILAAIYTMVFWFSFVLSFYISRGLTRLRVIR